MVILTIPSYLRKRFRIQIIYYYGSKIRQDRLKFMRLGIFITFIFLIPLFNTLKITWRSLLILRLPQSTWSQKQKMPKSFIFIISQVSWNRRKNHSTLLYYPFTIGANVHVILCDQNLSYIHLGSSVCHPVCHPVVLSYSCRIPVVLS